MSPALRSMNGTTPTPVVYRGTVAAAVAIGAILCASRLTWGLADGMWFPDEALWALRLDRHAVSAAGQVPHADLVYPTAYEYAGLVVGGLTRDTTIFAESDAAARAIGVARATSALTWMFAIIASAELGRLVGGHRRVGAIAAFLVATSPLAVLHVHSASVDPMLAAVSAGTLLAACRLVVRPALAAATVAGLAAGIGFATKYTGLALVCPVLWALIEVAPRARRTRTTAMVVALAVGGILLGVVLACPRCVAEASTVWRVLGWHHALAIAPTFDGNRLEHSVGWYGRRWLYQLVASMPYVLGAPTYALALGGLVLALRRPTPLERVVLSFVVPYFLVVGAARATFPRYLLPLVPAMAVFASSAIHRIMAYRPRFGAALATGAIAYSAALTVTQLTRLGWDQQYDVARSIAARGSPGAVAFPGYGSYFRLAEPLTEAGFVSSPREPREWFDPPAPYFVLPHWYATAIRRDDENAPLRADLSLLERGGHGYRPIGDWSTRWYLQRALDGWLDPALPTDLWHGAIGFTVYARDVALVADVEASIPPPGPTCPEEGRGHIR